MNVLRPKSACFVSHLKPSWSELAERIFLMKSFRIVRVQSIETSRYSGTRRWVQLIILNSTSLLRFLSEYIWFILITIYGAESTMSCLWVFSLRGKRKRISEFIPSQEDLWGQQLPPSVIIVTNGRENCEWYIPKWLINSTGQHYCIFPHPRIRQELSKRGWFGWWVMVE